MPGNPTILPNSLSKSSIPLSLMWNKQLNRPYAFTLFAKKQILSTNCKNDEIVSKGDKTKKSNLMSSYFQW